MSAEESKTAKSLVDTAPVRAGEEIDLGNLARYLREHLIEIEINPTDLAAEMTVAQFRGGHSNLTYLVRFGAHEFVMRRPPLGPVAPRAHDMKREFHLLESLNRAFPLAPRPVLLCEDASVIGATFYLMERRRGLIIRNEEPDGFDEPLRRRVSGSVVDTLADLHRIDTAANNLDALGKPEGFVKRQVRGWSERWRLSQTSEVAGMDALAAWLNEQLGRIENLTPSVVHGDFKLDNVMLDARHPSRVVAVLDWEMAAIGDPLIDLGILLAYWTHAPKIASNDSIAGVTNRAGWFTRDQIIERYAARSGRSVNNIEFYEVFAVFKLAVIIQQIFYRYVQGQTSDPRFAGLGERVTDLARVASELAAKL
jgi:aminoglycoside phosphotransferase (APT) family kinase protein